MHSVLRPFIWHRLQFIVPETKRQRVFARLHGTQVPRFSSGSENGIRIKKLQYKYWNKPAGVVIEALLFKLEEEFALGFFLRFVDDMRKYHPNE
jgi:hypothetical protein